MPVMYCVFAAPHQSTEAGGRQAYSRREILLTILPFAQCLLYCLHELEVFYPGCFLRTMGCPNDHGLH